MTPARPNKRRNWRYWSKCALSLVVGCLIAYGAAIFFAPGILCVRDVPAKAQAVIVLGGENWKRVPRAAELFNEGFAPLVIVSGKGDSGESRSRLIKSGVPSASVLVESRSTSTRENALLSVALLREHGITNAILVTSWYHSRRALACFETYAPDISFQSCPTFPDAKMSWPERYLRTRIQEEYAKTVWYLVRFGIWPL